MLLLILSDLKRIFMVIIGILLEEVLDISHLLICSRGAQTEE